MGLGMSSSLPGPSLLHCPLQPWHDYGGLHSESWVLAATCRPETPLAELPSHPPAMETPPWAETSRALLSGALLCSPDCFPCLYQQAGGSIQQSAWLGQDSSLLGFGFAAFTVPSQRKWSRGRGRTRWSRAVLSQPCSTGVGWPYRGRHLGPSLMGP